MTTIDKEAIFLAWLEKKNEESRRARAAQRREIREQQDYMEYRVRQGRLAYEKWLRGRLSAEEEIYKESIRQRQRKLLVNQERQKRQQESSKAYEKWKVRKNTEIKLSQSINRDLSPPPRAETPSLPGYCSVWSCDPHMSVTMTTRVKRPLSYSLTETCDYTLHRQKLNCTA